MQFNFNKKIYNALEFYLRDRYTNVCFNYMYKLHDKNLKILNYKYVININIKLYIHSTNLILKLLIS